MEISGIISALIIGLIIGVLGRLVLPGKQRVPIWLTILVGVANTRGIDWIEWAMQVALAAVGIGIADRAYARR